MTDSIGFEGVVKSSNADENLGQLLGSDDDDEMSILVDSADSDDENDTKPKDVTTVPVSIDTKATSNPEQLIALKQSVDESNKTLVQSKTSGKPDQSKTTTTRTAAAELKPKTKTPKKEKKKAKTESTTEASDVAVAKGSEKQRKNIVAAKKRTSIQTEPTALQVL